MLVSLTEKLILTRSWLWVFLAVKNTFSFLPAQVSNFLSRHLFPHSMYCSNSMWYLKNVGELEYLSLFLVNSFFFFTSRIYCQYSFFLQPHTFNTINRDRRSIWWPWNIILNPYASNMPNNVAGHFSTNGVAFLFLDS